MNRDTPDSAESTRLASASGGGGSNELPPKHKKERRSPEVVLVMLFFVDFVCCSVGPDPTNLESDFFCANAGTIAFRLRWQAKSCCCKRFREEREEEEAEEEPEHEQCRPEAGKNTLTRTTAQIAIQAAMTRTTAARGTAKTNLSAPRC